MGNVHLNIDIVLLVHFIINIFIVVISIVCLQLHAYSYIDRLSLRRCLPVNLRGVYRFATLLENCRSLLSSKEKNRYKTRFEVLLKDISVVSKEIQGGICKVEVCGQVTA